jgi:predicted molibdopterin-dependent oxidoreductase YjgC
MIIKMDDQEIEVSDSNKNIVEIADENGIGIPAPCFRQKKRIGCCKGCAITVNSVLEYACGIKPKEGMIIEVHTKKMIELRKRNILKYNEMLKQVSGSSCGSSCACDSKCCSDSDCSSNSNCCSDSDCSSDSDCCSSGGCS